MLKFVDLQCEVEGDAAYEVVAEKGEIVFCYSQNTSNSTVRNWAPPFDLAQRAVKALNLLDEAERSPFKAGVKDFNELQFRNSYLAALTADARVVLKKKNQHISQLMEENEELIERCCLCCCCC